MRPCLFLLLAALTGVAVRPAALRVASGPRRIALLELYTSEGCSSCPPAERWLATLQDDPGLWRAFVPVEFHVNYWDGLGWPDRFATRAFTERQYALAAGWGDPSVYTPCFVRNAVAWRIGSAAPADDRPAGELTVEWDGRSCTASFSSPAGAPPEAALEIHVAWLGGGLASRVTAGENRGTTLRHEFVALALSGHPLAAAGGGVWRAQFALPAPAAQDAPRRALAAWVTRRGSLVPLQAAGGWAD